MPQVILHQQNCSTFLCICTANSSPKQGCLGSPWTLPPENHGWLNIMSEVNFTSCCSSNWTTLTNMAGSATISRFSITKLPRISEARLNKSGSWPSSLSSYDITSCNSQDTFDEHFITCINSSMMSSRWKSDPFSSRSPTSSRPKSSCTNVTDNVHTNFAHL